MHFHIACCSYVCKLLAQHTHTYIHTLYMQGQYNYTWFFHFVMFSTNTVRRSDDVSTLNHMLVQFICMQPICHSSAHVNFHLNASIQRKITSTHTYMQQERKHKCKQNAHSYIHTLMCICTLSCKKNKTIFFFLFLRVLT